MQTSKTCYLNSEQKAYIWSQAKTHSFAWILLQLFGEFFTLEQTVSVYKFLNRNKYFDYISNVNFHNDVLRLAKEGISDDDIYNELKVKYKNLGPFQVSAVITANSQARRVGRWKNEDQRVLRFLYAPNSKKACQQVLYPRLLANIQKQASKLHLNFEKPATHTGIETRDCLTVGEIREVLSEYNDDDSLYIVKIGALEPVRIVEAGHKVGNRREHQNPTITILDV